MSDKLSIGDQFSEATGKEKARIFEQQMQAKSLASGNLSETQVSGILATVQADLLKQRTSVNAARARSNEDLLFLALLDQIEQLNQDIADMEAAFEAKYGDAWREELALKILDKDDIPERRADESIEDYRERLESVLIQELLNGDGSIKDEYKNDPDMREYAEWAQKNYNRDNAVAFARKLEEHGPQSPQAKAIVQDIAELNNSEIALQTTNELEGQNGHKGSVLKVDDSISDRTGSQSQAAFASGFEKPIQ